MDRTELADPPLGGALEPHLGPVPAGGEIDCVHFDQRVFKDAENIRWPLP